MNSATLASEPTAIILPLKKNPECGMQTCRNKANHLIVTKNNVPWYLCPHHFSLYMIEKTAQYHAAQQGVQSDLPTGSAKSDLIEADLPGIEKLSDDTASR